MFKPPVDPTSRVSGLNQKHITYSRLYASMQNTKFFLPLPRVPCNWPQVFKQTLIPYLGKNASVLLIGRLINRSIDPNIIIIIGYVFYPYLRYSPDPHQSTPLMDVHLRDTCARLYLPTQTLNKFTSHKLKVIHTVCITSTCVLNM